MTTRADNETPATRFSRRHIGPAPGDTIGMLRAVGAADMEELIAQAIPSDIRQKAPLDFGPALSETEALAHLRELAAANAVYASLIGQGYHGTIVPSPIQRNILENPAWYTAYTPYQPEISQGRLEALINYQTTVADLTGLDIANASLLDEATAAAEAMALARRVSSSKSNRFFVDSQVHPQTWAVLTTRAEPLGWELVCGDPEKDLGDGDFFGAVLQYGRAIDRPPPRAAVRAGLLPVERLCDRPLLEVFVAGLPRRSGCRTAGVEEGRQNRVPFRVDCGDPAGQGGAICASWRE
jgi:glycine dehydrogenase